MDDKHAAQRHPYCLSDVTTHWPTILYAETENTEKYLSEIQDFTPSLVFLS